MPNTITLIHVSVPMTEPFRISSGEVTNKESILVRIDLNGISAFGEASPMSGGFYSIETPDSTWESLLSHAIPAMIDDGTFQPEFVEKRMKKDKTEPFAWAGLEGALWDLKVQEEDRSFIDELGTTLNPIPSGLAVGIYPTVEGLLEACTRYLESGYQRLKIKIEPGWDIKPLQAIRETFGDIPLMVDANAAYTNDHFPIFDELDKMSLMMIEQPLAKNNIEGHAQLQARLSTPICLDESASDIEAVKQAIDAKACRIVNIKIQRLGGLCQAKKVYDLCVEHSIPTWMGTMPELGIGALHALYMSLLPNCTYPTDVEASSRWFVEDIIRPPIEVKNGMIEIAPEHSNRPSVDMDAVDRYTVREKSVLLM
ncbi:MAG: o-succinylbenzoate synthase [bacterium]